MFRNVENCIFFFYRRNFIQAKNYPLKVVESLSYSNFTDWGGGLYLKNDLEFKLETVYKIYLGTFVKNFMVT